MDSVVVKRTGSAEAYHRMQDGCPACKTNDHKKPELWKEWELDKAKVWKDPCQHPECFGEEWDRTNASGDKWPV